MGDCVTEPQQSVLFRREFSQVIQNSHRTTITHDEIAPGHKIRGTYIAFTASCDNRTVSKFARKTSCAFTLEYCAKTAVYDAILEQNARFRPIYGSLRRSVMIDLGSPHALCQSSKHCHYSTKWQKICLL